jgi:uncharacterized membrane protein
MRMSLGTRASGLLGAVVTLAYPVLVYLALGVMSPRALGLTGLSLVGLRLAIAAPASFAALARVVGPVAGTLALASLASLVWDDPLALLLTPAFVNAALFLAFGFSFLQGETVIETLARAQVGELSAEEQRYCRRVTATWCGFFVLNGAVSARLAIAADRATWALYCGFLAYLGMALLFAVEFVYRHWRFRRYVGLPTDRLLKLFFPPNPV